MIIFFAFLKEMLIDLCSAVLQAGNRKSRNSDSWSLNDMSY